MQPSERQFPITADQAGRAVQQFVRGQNRSRVMPQSPPMLQQFSKDNTVHIWNVGPWDHIRELGSAGVFRIAACPEGQEFAGPLSIPGLVEEPIPVDEQHFELRQEPGGGRYIAEQIIGVGMMLRKQDALTHFGVFIGEVMGFPGGKIPTPGKAELRKAKDELDEHYRKLIVEAREADAISPSDPRYAEMRGSIGERHYQAARSLNLTDEHWMMAAHPQGRAKCPFCTAQIDAGAVKCPNCKEIVDAKGYAELKTLLKG